jgi:hypothetical protein
MPHCDEFVALCVVLARYDLGTSLADIAERHASVTECPLPLAHLCANDFHQLLARLPRTGELFFRQVPLSSGELRNTTLGDVIGRMLEHHFVRATDTDFGWYVFSGKPIRSKHAALQVVLASPTREDPRALRNALESIYDCALPSFASE